MSGSVTPSIPIMPYSMIVGQAQIKRALELAFVAPRIGGVLLSGRRGTGKSTAVRAFCQMVSGRLPVTLPINATEDRVVGDLDVKLLIERGKSDRKPGLLEMADGGILYIDEVNLLDDHIVNIILDVTSTGVLVVQRGGLDVPDKEIRFTLVGTMNPAEGGLRPQLLDRFGLMVDVVDEEKEEVRREILEAVLVYDAARDQGKESGTGDEPDKLREMRGEDMKRQEQLNKARELFPRVVLPHSMASKCVRIGRQIQVEGHRGDYIIALAARANAALDQRTSVTVADLIAVAPLAMQHRRAGALLGNEAPWTNADDELVRDTVTARPDGFSSNDTTEAESDDVGS